MWLIHCKSLSSPLILPVSDRTSCNDMMQCDITAPCWCCLEMQEFFFLQPVCWSRITVLVLLVNFYGGARYWLKASKRKRARHLRTSLHSTCAWIFFFFFCNMNLMLGCTSYNVWFSFSKPEMRNRVFLPLKSSLAKQRWKMYFIFRSH